MRIYIIFAVIFSIMISGCSAGKMPVVPDSAYSFLDTKPIANLSDTNGSFSALGVLAAYELALNPASSSAELAAKRATAIGESYIVSGMGFFTISPCNTCLKIKSVAMPDDGIIMLTFMISHPFEPGDILKPPSAINRLDLDVFDPALLIVPLNIAPETYSLLGVTSYTQIISNMDGYTRELSNVLDDNSAMPYVLVIDDSMSVPPSSTWNEFEMGAETEFDVLFNLADDTEISFDLFLTMGYGASARKAQRLDPTYYNPEFNRKAAWKVDVIPPEGDDPPSIGNTWQDNDNSTSYNITVEAHDWQIGANINSDLENPTDVYAASEVSSVSVEIPGMNNTLQTVDGGTGSGSGMPGDPITFVVPIANENLLPAGEYTGLVKVADERNPLSPPPGDIRDYLIDSPDGIVLNNYEILEYATYQTFTATVVTGSTIQLTSPNGGEVWEIESNQNITWETTDYTGTIGLEYSKDGFVSDFNEIVPSTDDDGIFEWEIPDDESDTVRVRATLADAPMVFDDSDADFSIAASLWSDWTEIDDNSRMPRAVENEAGEIVLIWHKDSQGIRYTYNSGSGWQTPGLAYNTTPSFLHILPDQAGQTVYASYKAGSDRHAIRWTGGSGSWNYMWLWGYTGQPSILLPDDDGSFSHIYTYLDRFQVIGFNSWGSSWSGMAYYGGEDVRMSSCNFIERDNSWHYIVHRRTAGTSERARMVRGLKNTIYGWSTWTIYTGVTGETVDSVALCRETSGDLHSTWRVVDGSNSRIGYASSTDDGASWSAAVDCFNEDETILQDYVGIDTDSTGRIYVTYCWNDLYIYMVYSDDGVNWSTPSSPYDDSTMPIGYHYTQAFPLVSSDDVLHVFCIFKDSIFSYGDLYEFTYPSG